MYKVKFECDLLGDHTANVLDLCETDTIQFNSAFDAILFIEDCTNAITTVGEIIPWLAKNEIYFEEMSQQARPFSEMSKDACNIHLITNTNDFKQLIK